MKDCGIRDCTRPAVYTDADDAAFLSGESGLCQEHIAEERQRRATRREKDTARKTWARAIWGE